MKANKLWSIIMMLIIMLATSITLTSCDKDDDDAKGGDNKGLNGTIWVNYNDADYGIYPYLEFSNGYLKGCIAATDQGKMDLSQRHQYNWTFTPENGGWNIAHIDTYTYTVLNSNTIMSFNGQLIEITGNTMRRGDIIYKRYK